MSYEPRWDLIDKIPDDMPLYTDAESSDGQWAWPEWREELGHPYVQGHGYCKTCGPAITCMLAAFYDAVIMSTVRELDKVGGLVPRETSDPIAYTLGSLWFCTACGPQVENATPELEQNTFSCYRYDCDQCGINILPVRDVPRETPPQEETQ